MNDNHWYPRDPQRFLTDTAWCDAATEVAHNRMTDTYYALGRPIKDEASRVQLIGKIRDVDYMRVRGCLMELGWRVESGEWRHKMCEETMQEMETKRQDQIKRTAAALAARNVQRDIQRNVERDVERNDHLTTTTTTTSTDTHSRETEPPPGFPKTEQEAIEAGKMVGCTELVAVTEYHKAVSRGYTDAKGQTIRKFSSYLKIAQTYENARNANQTRNHNAPQSRTDGAQRVQDNQELQRVTDRMKTLKDTYGGHQTWDSEDKAEFAKLRARKQELKSKLGIVI